MEKVKIVPIENFLNALEVRKIRNECRIFMTRSTAQISFSQQLSWYLKVYKSNYRKGEMICFLLRSNKNNLGFGLIRKSVGKYWITGGLKSSQRGKGLGKILFAKLIEKVPSDEVWLEVLDSNFIAYNLYQELGFKQTEISEINGKKVKTMKLEKN
jgi:ribosomal protein S18 acetylase RimI-like enzyme